MKRLPFRLTKHHLTVIVLVRTSLDIMEQFIFVSSLSLLRCSFRVGRYHWRDVRPYGQSAFTYQKIREGKVGGDFSKLKSVTLKTINFHSPCELHSRLDQGRLWPEMRFRQSEWARTEENREHSNCEENVAKRRKGWITEITLLSHRRISDYWDWETKLGSNTE